MLTRAPVHGAQLFECTVDILLDDLEQTYFGTAPSAKAAKTAAAAEAVAALAQEPAFGGKKAKAALRGANAVATLNKLWQKVTAHFLPRIPVAYAPVRESGACVDHGCVCVFCTEPAVGQASVHGGRGLEAERGAPQRR